MAITFEEFFARFDDLQEQKILFAIFVNPFKVIVVASG